jgi:hypothetical protein
MEAITSSIDERSGPMLLGRTRQSAVRRIGCNLLFLIALVGCSDGRSTVSGTVTLDGQPLGRTETRNVTIMFMPESGSGTPASAMLDDSGYYVVATGAQSGLAPGKYIVTLAAIEASASGKRVVSPERYTNARESDLRADVEPGSNTFDFDLSSKGSG